MNKFLNKFEKGDIVMQRDYGKCEAYSLLHRLGKEIHETGDKSPKLRKVIGVLERSIEELERKRDEEKKKD